jgi:hypothetical protein
MAILLSELKWYGSAVMPDDDTVTAIGGAIDTSKKVEFFDNNGLVQLVSSTTVDTTQQVTVSYRLALTPAQVTTETRTLSGQTPVAFAANMERLLKAVKNAITQGDVAVESQAAVFTGTMAATGTTDQGTLPSGASAVDNFYQAMVIRITAGTGVGQIREIIQYVAATRLFWVSRAWDVVPDATSQFRISKGIVFEKTPFEIFQVRRPFFNSAADAPGGVVRTYFEKIFARNMSAVQTLPSALIHEQADLTGECTFGIASTTSDAGTNGGGNNRQVAPAAITFDNADKNVPGGTLGIGNIPGSGTTSSIGVWLKLTRQPGDAALNQPVTMRLQGVTI